MRPGCRPMKSPTMPGRAPKAGTISSIGAMANMSASVPARMGASSTPKGRRAQATERHPEMWLTVVETDGHGLIEDETLSHEEQGDEFLLMGLRLAEGIDPARFEALAGRSLDPARVSSLIAEGMVEMTPAGRLRVSAEGFPLLDAVVADLAA